MRTVTRRTFLGTGIAAAAPALRAATPTGASQGVAVSKALPDIVVVGAGAFGSWTALSLIERGAKVTLLDAYGPGHPRATSSDEVRQIRFSYGDREVYSRSARNAMLL
jgi:NADPH-dependent 2,4-dienoyl-CoA reductase/sulfur reductase-like enzyme